MPKPHEDRVVDVLRLFAPGARCQQEHSLPRDARRIDVVFGFDELPDFFGPLISPLANRMVAVEAFVRSPTRRQFGRSLTKLAVLTEDWLARARRASDRRAPVLWVVCRGTPRGVLGSFPCFVPTAPGMWRWNADHPGDVVITDLNHIDGDGTGGLAMLRLPRTSAEAHENVRRLLGDAFLSTLTKETMVQAILDGTVTTTAQEDRWTLRRALAVGEARGRRSTLLAIVAVRWPARLVELEQIDDIAALEARVLELLGGE